MELEIKLANDFFFYFLKIIESLLFIKIFSMPIIIIWVISLILFCNLKFNFIHIRLFTHALKILFTKHHNNKENGIISHLQAFFTSISGTIGLGTISGVAIAIASGGPIAVIWMAIIGILSMPVKFAEVTLGFKYRNNEDIFSGPFQYMKYGLANIGLIKTGKILAHIYAIILLISMLFGGIALQANQTVKLFTHLFTGLDKILIALLFILLIIIVIIGGISRIASINMKIMPITVPLYILGSVIIIITHIDRLPNTLHVIFHDIINYSSIRSGLLGSFIVGLRRSIFANEAGIGTAAISHAATRENEAIRVGCVAMLEPCIDTVIISFLTGVVIIITESYTLSTSGDIILASSAFLKLSPFFGYLIFPLIVFSFAFSTIITYSYYCEISWKYIFGYKSNINICRILIMLSIGMSCLSNDIFSISQLGDLLFMTLTIPNAIAIFLLHKDLSNDIKFYLQKNKTI